MGTTSIQSCDSECDRGKPLSRPWSGHQLRRMLVPPREVNVTNSDSF
jgi:hypothetical protein